MAVALPNFVTHLSRETATHSLVLRFDSLSRVISKSGVSHEFSWIPPSHEWVERKSRTHQWLAIFVTRVTLHSGRLVAMHSLSGQHTIYDVINDLRILWTHRIIFVQSYSTIHSALQFLSQYLLDNYDYALNCWWLYVNNIFKNIAYNFTVVNRSILIILWIENLCKAKFLYDVQDWG